MPAAMMFPVNMHFVSLSEKPEPDTITGVITAPNGGLGMVMMMLRGSTVNEATASHVSIPLVIATIFCVPIGPVTVKLSVKMPLAMWQGVGIETGSPAKEQEESVVSNPTPITLTIVPSGPEDGLRISDGGETVNEAEE